MAQQGERAELRPIVVEVGKASRKAVRRLRRGQGRLADEVRRALESVRANLGTEAAGKELVPVVLVYRKKRKRKSCGSGLIPFLTG